MIAYLSPGMHLFQEGQFEGRRYRVPLHLGRRPVEDVDVPIRTFYGRLLELLKYQVFRHGDWKLLPCRSGWDGSSSYSQFVAFAWEYQAARMFVAVNFGPTRGQCRIPLPWPDLDGKTIILRDRMHGIEYEREGGELLTPGLYLDVAEWQYHAFEVTRNDE
jgi:hypothetical protein